MTEERGRASLAAAAAIIGGAVLLDGWPALARWLSSLTGVAVVVVATFGVSLFLPLALIYVIRFDEPARRWRAAILATIGFVAVASVLLHPFDFARTVRSLLPFGDVDSSQED